MDSTFSQGTNTTQGVEPKTSAYFPVEDHRQVTIGPWCIPTVLSPTMSPKHSLGTYRVYRQLSDGEGSWSGQLASTQDAACFRQPHEE